MNARLATGALALAASALLAGCVSGSPHGTGPTASAPAGTAAYPLKLTASNGTVTIKAKPDRIVSLSPTATEDLFAVGAGRQVVAVDSDSDYPPHAPVTSLTGLSPNVEAIARYRPDLVVASQNTGGLVSGLAKLGVPVLIEPAAASLDGAYAQISQLGRATGHNAQASKTVATMRSQIAAAVRRAGSGHADLTYYWELSAKPFFSATSRTFIGQLVSLFGLKNVADAADKAADGGYPELTEEYIVAARPQIIFLADSQASDGGQTPSLVAGRAGWSGIPAVKDHELIGLNGDISSRWGPRLPQLVAEIAAAVRSAGRSR